jgi:hypothetical protein
MTIIIIISSFFAPARPFLTLTRRTNGCRTGLCKSFAVIQRNKKAGNAARGTLNPMRVRWQYIYYGEKTANKRGLKEHVKKNKESKIIS